MNLLLKFHLMQVVLGGELSATIFALESHITLTKRNIILILRNFWHRPKDMTTTLGNGMFICREMGFDPILTSLDQPIEFLTKIFESGTHDRRSNKIRPAICTHH